MCPVKAFGNSKEPDENTTYLINLGTAINTEGISLFHPHANAVGLCGKGAPSVLQK
jgi:hypothetical protein